MAFSAGVRLADLNDHITPGVACINPAVGGTAAEDVAASGNASTDEGYSVSIHGSRTDTVAAIVALAEASKEGVVAQVMDGSKGNLKPATITLNDCLACSGCITSAEAVLVNMQDERLLSQRLTETNEARRVLASQEVGTKSREEIHDLEEAARRVFVVSISPQSRASLAVKFNTTSTDVHRRLATFLRAAGVSHVYDTSYARDVSLMVGAREFVRRFQTSTDTQQIIPAEDGSPKTLPMLASSCPGWVCYAEKSQHSLLPLIDNTKSPQQIMGSLVKSSLSERYGVPLTSVFHTTIMPCYDKKLEASRADFAQGEAKDVDCVITTGQLLRMMIESGVHELNSIPPSDLRIDSEFTKLIKRKTQEDDMAMGTDIDTDTELALARSYGSSSGGYLAYIFRYASKVLFGIDIPASDFDTRPSYNTVSSPYLKKIIGRNSDWIEYLLMIEGKVKLRFASTYGFRNIQNLVRKIDNTSESNGDNQNKAVGKGVGVARRGFGSVQRRGAGSSQNKMGPLHFVEVMACPSGCINGGGQLIMNEDLEIISGSSSGAIVPKSIQQKVQQRYDEDVRVDPEEDVNVQQTLQIICNKYGLSSINDERFQMASQRFYIKSINGQSQQVTIEDPGSDALAGLFLTQYHEVAPLAQEAQPLAVGSNW